VSDGREKQAIVREVNKRIRELNAAFGATAGTCTLLCECGATGCFERIVVQAEATDARLVAPGHERHTEADEVAA
jgi:hypothetical protein